MLAAATLAGVFVATLLLAPSTTPGFVPTSGQSAPPVAAAVATIEVSPYDGGPTAMLPDGQPHPHIVPVAGKSVSVPTIDFSFGGKRYSIKPYVDPAVYWGARASTRLLIQPDGQSEQQWSEAYYRAFAEDPAQQATVDDLADQLRAIRDRAGLDGDQYLELIAKYVQSIPYDTASYKSGKGRQRFVVETLVEGTGMCGDKSVLLATLLAHEGYSAALLDFTPEKHMAVGVRGPGSAYGNTGWLFLETTGPCYVTDIPDTYLGGIKLESEPKIITIGSGAKQYGAAFDVSRIIRARESADAAAKSLLAKAKSQTLTRSEATAINDKLDLAYQATVSLRANAVDSKGRSVGSFMDRAKAISWVDRNAWWL